MQQQGDEKKERSFEEEAKSGQQAEFGELWDYLRHNKKWWLTPVIVVLILVGVLVIFGSTAAAPFIYTLF